MKAHGSNYMIRKESSSCQMSLAKRTLTRQNVTCLVIFCCSTVTIHRSNLAPFLFPFLLLPLFCHRCTINNAALIALTGHVPSANKVNVAFVYCWEIVNGGRRAALLLVHQLGRSSAGKCAPNDQSVNHHLISLIVDAVGGMLQVWAPFSEKMSLFR